MKIIIVFTFLLLTSCFKNDYEPNIVEPPKQDNYNVKDTIFCEVLAKYSSEQYLKYKKEEAEAHCKILKMKANACKKLTAAERSVIGHQCSNIDNPCGDMIDLNNRIYNYETFLSICIERYR